MTEQLQVRETPAALWAALADVWRTQAGDAVRRRGFFAAALSGGSTPGGFYRHLAREPGLPWHRTHLFLVDERLVPPESVESNARMIRESLLDHLAVRPAGVHVAATDPPDADAAAARYEEQLRGVFSGLGAPVPQLDLVLLGIGEDGHTASLFPGTAALEERSRLVAGVPSAAGRAARVTLTLPQINASRRVIFIVTGAAKRRILERVVAGDPTLPAARVAPGSGAVQFFVDREASPAAGPAAR